MGLMIAVIVAFGAGAIFGILLTAVLMGNDDDNKR